MKSSCLLKRSFSISLNNAHKWFWLMRSSIPRLILVSLFRFFVTSSWSVCLVNSPLEQKNDKLGEVFLFSLIIVEPYCVLTYHFHHPGQIRFRKLLSVKKNGSKSQIIHNKFSPCRVYRFIYVGGNKNHSSMFYCMQYC